MAVREGWRPLKFFFVFDTYRYVCIIMMEAFPDVVQRVTLLKKNPPPPSFETGTTEELYNYLHIE